MKYHSIIKRNEVPVLLCNMDKPWKYPKWKKQDAEGHVLYDSIYICLRQADPQRRSRRVTAMGTGGVNRERLIIAMGLRMVYYETLLWNKNLRQSMFSWDY